ncbi:MAG: DegT/DnrJ/EryC1/StrS family aminotransferase [Alphaproteobacteria bacterium]|nr:DegT/DnrJ/EryC1/StrS family aminotransferase [Alphaproteobacteria bacterium]
MIAVANATAGLSLCLLAARAAGGGNRADGLCVLPSWTHEATAIAVVRAGLTPWFHDVDEASWRLDPDRVADEIRADPRVVHVMVTAPFGARVPLAPWADLSERTGIGVTIDAAAGFDGLRGGPVDAVISLHATKILGIGEGGVVVARDAARASLIRRLARFGLSENRVIDHVGMNAKLSEYAAAVGLAALDEWPARRAGFAWRRERYVARLDGRDGIRVWRPEGLSSSLMVRLPAPTAVETAEALRRLGIETRRWWHAGCHRQPALEGFPRRPLPVTEALAESVLGLPHHDDLDASAIDRVAAALLALTAD